MSIAIINFNQYTDLCHYIYNLNCYPELFSILVMLKDVQHTTEADSSSPAGVSQPEDRVFCEDNIGGILVV
jgi:hypothetical protein